MNKQSWMRSVSLIVIFMCQMLKQAGVNVEISETDINTILQAVALVIGIVGVCRVEVKKLVTSKPVEKKP